MKRMTWYATDQKSILFYSTPRMPICCRNEYQLLHNKGAVFNSGDISVKREKVLFREMFLIWNIACVLILIA